MLKLRLYNEAKKGPKRRKMAFKKNGVLILNLEEIRGWYYIVFLVEIGKFIKFAKTMTKKSSLPWVNHQIKN